MADIKVRIIAEDKASDVLKQTGKAVDDAGKKAKEAGGAFEGMGNSMLNIAGALGLQMGLQAVVSGLKNAVVGSFELAAALETTKVGFTTMLGSGEAAQGMLDNLKAFADTTPFEFADLTTAASKMVAMGTAAEDVIPILTTVGDTAAGLGLGKAGIDRITLALGQMGAKGKIGGDDLRQLAEAGVPALKYLADGAGVTTAEMSKMIEKGLVPAKEGVQVLLANMKQDFGGLMAKQAETASGKLSTMKDAVAGLGTEIGKSLVPAAKDGADFITQMAIAATKYVIAARTEQETLLALDDALRKHLITEEQFLAVTEVAPRPIGELRYAWEQTTFVIKDATAAQELLKQATQKAADTASFFTPSLDDLKTAAQDAAKKNTELADAINAKAVADLAAKAATDAHTASLKLQSDMSNLVGGALKEYETDSKKNAKTIADTEKAIADLTAQHGKSQVAILAGSGTIVDNTTELLKSSLAHRDLKQDVQQLNEKQAAGQISGEDYTLAMDHLNVKILEQDEAHGKLVATQGTGLTALQQAGTEQGNYTIKLGEMNTKLQEAKDKDIALQTQIATRIKEGILLQEIALAAEGGFTEAEILMIDTAATALGVADSDAVQGAINTGIAATTLAALRTEYEKDFREGNAEGVRLFGIGVDQIGSDITNKLRPSFQSAEDAIDEAKLKLNLFADTYNGLNSKEITLTYKEVRIKSEVILQNTAMAAAGVAVSEPGMSAVVNVPTGGGGGTASTSALAGARAAGGSVMGAAGTYLVGEMGPELFNPAGNGMIIPNSMLGGMGGGGSLRIGTLNLYGVQSASELFNQLSKEARARGLQFAAN